METKTTDGLALSLDEVEAAAREILMSFGFSPDLAGSLAKRVRLAERDGPSSHGLAILGHYKACADSGTVTLAPKPHHHMARPGMMIVDCDGSFAPYATGFAKDAFIDAVRQHGIATMVTKNAFHLSALRHDVLPLAEAGLIAIMMSGTMPWLVPHGGNDAVFGTNPMAFACPRPGAPPIIWDQASTIQSISDIRLAAREGRLLQAAAGLDRAGNPTRVPEEIIETRHMLPFGGYKGTAIALMIEIMTAGLSGGRFAVEYRGDKKVPANTAGQLLIAIDPEAVEPGFVNRLQVLLDAMADNGSARIPGDGRFQRQRQAESEGVRLSPALRRQLIAFGWQPPGSPKLNPGP